MFELEEVPCEGEDGERRIGYGIKCGSVNFSNLSFTREPVEALVTACNAQELHPCQLLDVAQDFLEKQEPNCQLPF